MLRLRWHSIPSLLKGRMRIPLRCGLSSFGLLLIEQPHLNGSWNV